MSPDPFDLEPEGEQRGPLLPPERPGLVRTRTEADLAAHHVGRGRRFSRAGPALRWLTAPGTYYVLGIATAASVLLVHYNPAFGLTHEGWPFEVFRAGDLWGAAQAGVVAGVVPLATLIAVLCMRDPRRRAVLAAAAIGFPALAWMDARPALLALAMALVAGSLMGAGRGRQPYLFAFLLLLAAPLFAPTGTGRAYTCAALQAIDGLFGAGGFRDTPAHLTGAFGLLLLGAGLLGWIRLGGGWVGFVAGALVLALFVWEGIVLYGSPGAWPAGPQAWAAAMPTEVAPYALALTGAAADWTRGRAED